MGKYNFTDKDDMIGKKPRQIYWTELQDAVNDLDDNIEDLAGEGRTIETVKENADKIDVLTGDLDEHKAEMATSTNKPHGINTAATQIYEEGVFTPIILGSKVAGNNTYNVQVGRYKRIGNIVTFLLTVRVTTKDPLMAGGVIIGGLPFVSIQTTSVAIGRVDNVTFSTNSKGLAAHTTNGGSTIYLSEIIDNASYLPLSETKITTNTLFFVSGTYQI